MHREQEDEKLGLGFNYLKDNGANVVVTKKGGK